MTACLEFLAPICILLVQDEAHDSGALEPDAGRAGALCSNALSIGARTSAMSLRSHSQL